MANQYTPRPAGFRLEITRAGWIIMGVYGLLWLALFAFTYWTPAGTSRVTVMMGPGGEFDVPTRFELADLLVLQQAASDELGTTPDFRWWQLLSAPLVYHPSAFGSLLLGCLGLMFFAAPVERLLGVGGLLQLWFVSCLGGAVGALVLGLVFPVPPASGFAPAMLAIMLVHCMMTPEATVPFFFVLHVKLKWVALGIAALVVLRALAVVGQGLISPEGRVYFLPYELAGAAAGYFFWRSGASLDPRRLFRRRRARRNLRLAVDRLVQDAAQDDDPVFH